MSKYQLKCSCIYCGIETTIQSLKAHTRKCTTKPSNECQCCGVATENKKFCSRSCRAKVVNTQRPRKQKEWKPSSIEKGLERFHNGEMSERSALRKYIALERGYECAECSIAEWNGQTITLIVDHIDGDAGNNYPSNLRLLCPNCNSLTPTFSGKNKGNGRKARSLPLK